MAMCTIVMQTEISVFAIDYCDYCGYCGSIDSLKKSNSIFPFNNSHHNTHTRLLIQIETS